MSNVSNKVLGYTEEEVNFIQAMRERGFAVAVFSPGELMGADPKKVEHEMVEMGGNAIEFHVREEMEKWGK